MTTTKKTFEVEDLFIDEGAFVDEGDNPKANIRMFKLNGGDSDDDTDEEPAVTIKADDVKNDWRPSTTSEILAAQEFHERFWKVRSAFSQSVSQIMCGSPEDMPSLFAKTTAEFLAEVKRITANLKAATPDLVKHVDVLCEGIKSAAATGNGDAITTALDAFDAFKSPESPQEPDMTTPKTPPAASIADALAKLDPESRKIVQAQLDAADEATKAAAKAKEDADKAAADAVQAQIKAANDAAKAAQDEVAKLRDEKLTAEFQAKAKEIGAGDVDEVAGLLKSAFGRSKEEGEKLEKTLRAMAAQARLGMKPGLKVVGSDDAGSSPGGTGNVKADADAQLNAKAEEIRKANPALTAQQAYAKACDDPANADLVKVAFAS